MSKEILYKYAEDNRGKIIHINNALLGESYYCPECKEKFIFKKGKIRQQHFAHNNTSSNCTGEGYLHKTFKKMLLELINDYVIKKLPLDINWNCNICKSNHNSNLLRGINDVKDEYNLEVCRPDIVLINDAGIVPVIIEIVDKHEPEKNVIDYCVKNNIILIRIKLDSINDLDNVEDKIKFPTNLLFFNQLRCPIFYRNYLIQQPSIPKQLIQNYNRIRRSGPNIDQIEASHERDRQRKQHFAIQSYYKKKYRKK
jgi:hypothetical protein